MKLIINADDFGYSRGQNLGIIDCFYKGLVTSTTLLNTMESCYEAYQLALDNPALDVGAHLSLDLGSPVCDPRMIPSLVDDQLCFKIYDLSKGDIYVNPHEVYLEWKAQIERMINHGVTPTHMDSHHHIHMMPSIFDVYVQLAKEYQLGIRFHPRTWSKEQIEEALPKIKGLKRVEKFDNRFYQEGATPDYFDLLAEEDVETVEIMCHPAYLDQYILDNSSYNIGRVKEAYVLQCEESKEKVINNNIELISFRDL